MREFDIVVVGAGLSGGLPAAAYLQRAGQDVVLLEQGIEAGSFFRSYEVFPGVLFDHSPVNFSDLSPVVEDLQLREHGYALEPTEIAYSTIDRAGTSLTIETTPARTAAALARRSPADSDAWTGLMRRLAGVADELLELVFYTAHPDQGALDRAIEVTADVVGVERGALETMTAPDLVERLFADDFVRRSMMALPALNLFGDLLIPGQGALSWAWALLMRARTAPSGNGSLVRAVEAAFTRAGGTILRDATVTRLIVDDGICTGVLADRGGRAEPITARRAVISNVGAGHLHELLAPADERLPSPEQRQFVDRLGSWQSRQRTIAIQDLVLRRPLRWPGDGGLLGRSPRVYLVWDSFAACRDWLERCRHDDESIYFDDIEVTQYHAIYGAREDGLAAVRVRYGTGPYLDDDGTTAWDARRAEFSARMLALLERIDPELPKNIVYEHLTTPLDFWRGNPGAHHGNPVGGDLVSGQWISSRLPYRTPVDRLYCSNSVWPPGLSLMASGYNVACTVADDLDLVRPPWWRHRAGANAVIPTAEATTR